MSYCCSQAPAVGASGAVFGLVSHFIGVFFLLDFLNTLHNLSEKSSLVYNVSA